MKNLCFRVGTIVPLSLCIFLLLSAICCILTGCKTNPPEIVEPEITDTPTEIPAPEPTEEPSPEPAETPVPEEKPYYIEILPPEEKKEFILDPFSFIHAFYSTVFYDFNLTDIIPQDERLSIMKQIFDELTRNSQVNFVIRKYLDVDKLMFVFLFSQEKQKTVLNLKTNYDARAGVLVPLDMPREEWKRCESFTYFLILTKLVQAKNLYSITRENEFTAQEQLSELLHFFVFDDNYVNDFKVEEYAQNILSRNPGDKLTVKIMLELIYHYLSQNRIEEAENMINRAGDYSFSRENKEMKRLLQYISEETAILKVFLAGYRDYWYWYRR